MKELYDITLDQMKTATTSNTYNVVSTDICGLSMAFYGAVVDIDPEYGTSGEIVIHKPGTLCEVKIDCDDILESIETDGEGYFLISFNNGLPYMEITRISQ